MHRKQDWDCFEKKNASAKWNHRNQICSIMSYDLLFVSACLLFGFIYCRVTKFFSKLLSSSAAPAAPLTHNVDVIIHPIPECRLQLLDQILQFLHIYHHLRAHHRSACHIITDHRLVVSTPLLRQTSSRKLKAIGHRRHHRLPQSLFRAAESLQYLRRGSVILTRSWKPSKLYYSYYSA